MCGSADVANITLEAEKQDNGKWAVIVISLLSFAKKRSLQFATNDDFANYFGHLIRGISGITMQSMVKGSNESEDLKNPIFCEAVSYVSEIRESHMNDVKELLHQRVADKLANDDFQQMKRELAEWAKHSEKPRVINARTWIGTGFDPEHVLDPRDILVCVSIEGVDE